MNERRKILWLVSWYPNKYDPFDGDFIQRHARAAALHHNVHVLFVKQSPAQATLETEWNESGGLTEQIIYLPRLNGLFAKVANHRRWQKEYRSAVALLMKNDCPDLIHVHVPWKTGLVALWAKRKFRIPYVVTEHWGIYNRVAADNVYKRSVLFRYLVRRIFKKATAFVSVSQFLGHGVNQALLKKEFAVVPNVADTSAFRPSGEKAAVFTFVHVSNMVPLKNVEGILSAFQSFRKQTGADAQLVLVGNKDETYPRLAQNLKLPVSSYRFTGEVSYAQVAGEMRRSHAFVLNSDMENSPCVIGEALCCGLPVIGTNVGGVPELVNGANGLLIPPRSPNALADAMSRLYRSYENFDTGSIAARASERFSMEAVGRQFANLYATFVPQ